MGTIYLIFSILSVILAVGIATSIDDNTDESSVIHVRTKRLIERVPGGARRPAIQEFGHATILYEIEEPSCTAVILLANVLLTTAMCVYFYQDTLRYRVYSGTADRNNGTPHVVMRIRHYSEFSPDNIFSGNIALVTIDPPIDFKHSVNRKIKIYSGGYSPNTALVNTSVNTCGWGYTLDDGGHHKILPDELRSITVPIISERQCVAEYGPHNIIPIDDKVICTFDKNRSKYASRNDCGNPLVYMDHHLNEHLLGILFCAWDNGQPDIYINLHHPPYKAWIVARLLEIASGRP